MEPQKIYFTSLLFFASSHRERFPFFYSFALTQCRLHRWLQIPVIFHFPNLNTSSILVILVTCVVTCKTLWNVSCLIIFFALCSSRTWGSLKGFDTTLQQEYLYLEENKIWKPVMYITTQLLKSYSRAREKKNFAFFHFNVHPKCLVHDRGSTKWWNPNKNSGH